MATTTYIDAILWDYDGTIANSASKNIAITKQIISDVVPRLSGKNLPIHLKTESQYHIANHKAKNWQDLYLNFYKMTFDEMLTAGKLWSIYQQKNQTEVTLFSQIKETVNQINIPQGICSQNSTKNITKTLLNYNLNHKFSSIIGYDDIPNDKQKPAPFGGIKCLNQILHSLENKTIIYIGDHQADIEFAKNIEKELDSCKIISIGVTYSGADISSWQIKPDIILEKPMDLINFIATY